MAQCPACRKNLANPRLRYACVLHTWITNPTVMLRTGARGYSLTCNLTTKCGSIVQVRTMLHCVLYPWFLARTQQVGNNNHKCSVAGLVCFLVLRGPTWVPWTMGPNFSGLPEIHRKLFCKTYVNFNEALKRDTRQIGWQTCGCF